MRAKEYLLQYRRALERVRQLDQRIEALYLQAEIQATAPKEVSVRGSGLKRDRVAELATKIADGTTRLNDQRLEALRLCDEVSGVIDAVTDPTYSRILFDRYVGGLGWDQIADDIGYDPSHTRGRLHGSALAEAQKIIDRKQVTTKYNKRM